MDTVDTSETHYVIDLKNEKAKSVQEKNKLKQRNCAEMFLFEIVNVKISPVITLDTQSTCKKEWNNLSQHR